MSEYELEETETTINVKSYTQGYKDGYNDAVMFYIINPYINTSPDHFKCPVCGLNGMHNMVCSKSNCPSLITSQVKVGAMGSTYVTNTPPSANGPTGEVSRR
jgi:hypothetical protein